MTISRDSLRAPVLPRERVQVNSLGGEIIIRGLLLRERLALQESLDKAGSDPMAMAYELMARVAVLDDEQPVFDAAQWEVFSSTQTPDYVRLIEVARRLNGFDIDDVKKN